MKKFGNYLIAISLIFSAAVWGAALIDQSSEDSLVIGVVTGLNPTVDTMGNVTGD
jgi:hypothetical protein